MADTKQPIRNIETTVARLNALLEKRGSAKRISITSRYGIHYLDVSEIPADGGEAQHVKTIESGSRQSINYALAGMVAMIDIIKL